MSLIGLMVYSFGQLNKLFWLQKHVFLEIYTLNHCYSYHNQMTKGFCIPPYLWYIYMHGERVGIKNKPLAQKMLGSWLARQMTILL